MMLTGCGNLWNQTKETEPTRISQILVTPEIFQPDPPKGVRLEDLRWYVLTTENLDEKIAEVKTLQGGDFVLYGMTPQSYENMSYNIRELERYIKQQQKIINYYRSATIVVKKPESVPEEETEN